MRKLLVVSMLASGVWLVAQPTAWACSCVPGGFPVHAKTADAVFTGVLRGIDGDQVELVAEFAVERVYRGDVGNAVEVRTPGGGGPSCGYPHWEEGSRYTLTANANPDGDLSTSICSGILRGAIDPAEYGLPAGEPRDPPPSGYSWWVVPAGVVIGVGGGLLIVRSLKRRRT
jgi:hypothetical protein